MPNGMSERSVLIEHCGVGGSVRKDTLYPMPEDYGRRASLRLTAGRMVCNEVRAPLWWPSEAVIITGLQKRLLKRSSDRAETTDTARQEDGRR